MPLPVRRRTGFRQACRLGVAESALSDSRDPEPSAAIWIRASDLGIRRHPVVRIGAALLGRKERQHRRKRIHRNFLASRKYQILAFDGEELTLDMPADRLPAIQNDLDFQVVKRELVVALQAEPLLALPPDTREEAFRRPSRKPACLGFRLHGTVLPIRTHRYSIRVAEAINCETGSRCAPKRPTGRHPHRPDRHERRVMMLRNDRRREPFGHSRKPLLFRARRLRGRIGAVKRLQEAPNQLGSANVFAAAAHVSIACRHIR